MFNMLVVNEKMIKKVMVEIRDFRVQKCYLEEFFMSVKDEFRVNKVEYEVKFDEMERMLEGFVEKFKNLESEKRK